MSEKAVPAKKKRGPKPLGPRSMTPTERKQRSRLRQAGEGYAEFTVRASGDTLNFLDLYAKSNGVSRTDVVEAFLDLAVNRLAQANAHALQRMKEGASAQEAMTVVHDELAFKADVDAIETFMEVLRPA